MDYRGLISSGGCFKYATTVYQGNFLLMVEDIDLMQ
jgi:hypothetical protein